MQTIIFFNVCHTSLNNAVQLVICLWNRFWNIWNCVSGHTEIQNFSLLGPLPPQNNSSLKSFELKAIRTNIRLNINISWMLDFFNFCKRSLNITTLLGINRAQSCGQSVGASVAEWLRSLTGDHRSLTAVGSILTRVEIFHVRKPSSWLTEGRWCPLVPEIMPGGAPGVFLHQ
jgi:hypothetical protein